METSASSLGKTFKALGGMIVAAFSIKAITDFSKAAMVIISTRQTQNICWMI